MRLDIKIKELSYSTSYGSGTLKSLQNNSEPELDLLVREAVQNSSDASLSLPDSYFGMDFNLEKFRPARFNSCLTCITDILNERYNQETAEYLEIRDYKTSGLTGPVRLDDIKSDDHGNFFKLVYETGKEQTQKGAGGNWGFGKSVYYRVGIGIVVYYSRISPIESRLIITLVEKETDNEAILRNINAKATGTAWWGKAFETDELLPITNEDEIKEILDIFRVAPFSDNETGTSIIIPYIDKVKLMKVIPENAEITPDERERCIWANNITEYLKLSLQKWYAPKVHNVKLPRINDSLKWLRLRVNGEAITVEQMKPIFRLVQELYNHAVSANAGKEYKSELFPKCVCEAVRIRKYLEREITGHVAFVIISEKELNQGQSAMSPYIYLRKFVRNIEINEPIIAFAREPGMVIDYQITDDWAKRLNPSASKEDYIVCFYVPDTKNILQEERKRTLGEYLRACEKSDHIAWYDESSYEIVSRIKLNTALKVNQKTAQEDLGTKDGMSSRLSLKLGRKLLPRIGFGDQNGKGSSGGGGNGGGNGGLGNKGELIIKKTTLTENGADLEFELIFDDYRDEYSFELIAVAEVSRYNCYSWEKENGIEIKFPASIEAVNLSSITFGEKTIKVEQTECTTLTPNVSNDFVSLNLMSSKTFDTAHKIVINRNQKIKMINGLVKLIAYDRKYEFMFR